MKSKIILGSNLYVVEEQLAAEVCSKSGGGLELKEAPYKEWEVTCTCAANSNGGCCSGFCAAT